MKFDDLMPGTAAIIDKRAALIAAGISLLAGIIIVMLRHIRLSK